MTMQIHNTVNLLTDARPMRCQRGMTLIELMIALVLGLILIAGVIQIFIANRATYAFNEGLARIQEHGRFALDHIAHTTRMGGYVGCLRDITIHNNLNAQWNFRDDVRNGVQGFNANGTGVGQTFAAAAVNPAASPTPANWTPNLPAELNNLVIPGSDVLVVRSVSPLSTTLVPPFSSSAQLFVEDPAGFQLGDIAVVTDCQKASIFQITNITGVGFGANVVHSNSGSVVPGNAGPQLGQSYGLGSELATLQATAFYIGVGTNGTPALFQFRLQRINDNLSQFVPEELVGGIDTMQVRYGLDTDNNGSVDVWQTADAIAATDWQLVASVEISLLIRASEEYGLDQDTTVYNVGGVTFDPQDDRRFRQVFSTTISLRNRLP